MVHFTSIIQVVLYATALISIPSTALAALDTTILLPPLNTVQNTSLLDASNIATLLDTCGVNELIQLPSKVARNVNLEFVSDVVQTGLCTVYLLNESLGNPIKLMSNNTCTVSKGLNSWQVPIPEGVVGPKVLRVVFEVVAAASTAVQKLVQCVGVNIVNNPLLHPALDLIKRDEDTNTSIFDMILGYDHCKPEQVMCRDQMFAKCDHAKCRLQMANIIDSSIDNAFTSNNMSNQL
ncbi:hypothetical protein BDF19DRAFT_498156 [Syncephalis fuscata]|nr:hypothetical protein BDF19DRAFT_498156 [Syncephalis fuscata]